MASTYGREREETWDRLQERLKKSRRRPAGSRQSTASSTRSYNGKTTPKYRNGYHRTPPPKILPHLDTPPGYNTPSMDTPVSAYPGNLRRSTYEVVPPLVPREDAFEREPRINGHFMDDPRDGSDYYEPRQHRDYHDRDYPDPIDQRNFLDPRDPRSYAHNDPSHVKGHRDPSKHGYSNRSKQSSGYYGNPKDGRHGKPVSNGYSHKPSQKSDPTEFTRPDDVYSSLRYNGYKPGVLGVYPYQRNKKKKKKLLVRYRKGTDTESDTSSRTSSALSQLGYLPGENKYLSPGPQYLPTGEHNPYNPPIDPGLQYIHSLPANPYISPRGPVTYLTVGPDYANPDKSESKDPDGLAIALAAIEGDLSGRVSKYDELGSLLKQKKKKRGRRRRLVTPDEAAVRIQSVYRGFRTRQGLESANYLRDENVAEKFVDDFIKETLESELIPDLLIDALSENKKRHQQKDQSLYVPALLCCEDIVDETVQEMVDEVVVKTTAEMLDSYMDEESTRKDYIDDCSRALLNEIVKESVELVVADTIEDLVQDHLNRAAVYDTFMEIFEEVEKPHVVDAVREAIFEVVLEDLIEDFVLEETHELHKELAEETLARYDAAVIKKQHREVATHAGEVVIESFFLDYLLTMIARNGQIWTEREYFDKFLDAMTLDILMTQYFNVRDQRKLTEDNFAMKQFHEEVTTDVLMNSLVTELGEQLEADMDDLHEYETELDQPEEETPRLLTPPAPPPIDLRLWMGKSNLLRA